MDIKRKEELKVRSQAYFANPKIKEAMRSTDFDSRILSPDS